MWRKGARRSCDTEYENASSSSLAAFSSRVRALDPGLELCVELPNVVFGALAFGDVEVDARPARDPALLVSNGDASV